MRQMDQDKAYMNQILPTALSSEFIGKPLKDFEQWDVDWFNRIYIFKKSLLRGVIDWKGAGG